MTSDDLLEQLRAPDWHDPACPFKEHCYCEDGAPHDHQRHPAALEAAARIEALTADRDAALAAIRTQAGAIRTLHASKETEINRLRKKEREWHTATTTLDSEREANARMTEELERLTAERDSAEARNVQLLCDISAAAAHGEREGERRATAAIVAWLRHDALLTRADLTRLNLDRKLTAAMNAEWESSIALKAAIASAIERGDHMKPPHD